MITTTTRKETTRPTITTKADKNRQAHLWGKNYTDVFPLYVAYVGYTQCVGYRADIYYRTGRHQEYSQRFRWLTSNVNVFISFSSTEKVLPGEGDSLHSLKRGDFN